MRKRMEAWELGVFPSPNLIPTGIPTYTCTSAREAETGSPVISSLVRSPLRLAHGQYTSAVAFVSSVNYVLMTETHKTDPGWRTCCKITVLSSDSSVRDEDGSETAPVKMKPRCSATGKAKPWHVPGKWVRSG